MTRHDDITQHLAQALNEAGTRPGQVDPGMLTTAVLAIADNLMTPHQVSEYLGIPRTSIQRLYRRPTNGNLRVALNVDGRSPMFYRPDVVDWARKHRDKIRMDAPVVEDIH